MKRFEFTDTLRCDCCELRGLCQSKGIQPASSYCAHRLFFVKEMQTRFAAWSLQFAIFCVVLAAAVVIVHYL